MELLWESPSSVAWLERLRKESDVAQLRRGVIVRSHGSVVLHTYMQSLAVQHPIRLADDQALRRGVHACPLKVFDRIKGSQEGCQHVVVDLNVGWPLALAR